MPLKNERAARQISTPYLYRDERFNCTCPTRKAIHGGHGQSGCEHDKARYAEQRRLFDEAYEIVPVRLEIIDGI
jgi:hypothetical protein